MQHRRLRGTETLTDDDEDDDVNGILVPHMTIVNFFSNRNHKL